MRPRRVHNGARQADDSRLLSAASGIPIVVRLDDDAATRLKVDLDTLVGVAHRARFDGRLQVWGRHADGRPVYRLRELEALLEREVAGASR